MRLSKPTETDLVYMCLDYLRMRGIPAWRQNVGLSHGADGRAVRFGFPGIPDILGWVPRKSLYKHGRMLAIECKVGNRKLTPDQSAFLDRLNADGGIGVVVRDLDDLVAMIESLLA